MIIRKKSAFYLSAILLSISNIAFAMNQVNSEVISNSTSTQSFAYVNQGKNCSVAMINLKSNQLSDTIQISTDPNGCILESVVSPKRDQLYAINAHQHGTDQYVHVFDIKSHTLVNSILVSSKPIRTPLSNIIMKPDGSHVYVSSYGAFDNDVVWDIDTRTQKTSMIDMGRKTAPQKMVISSDGSKLYIATRGENTITVIDTTNNTVVGVMEGADGANMVLSRDDKILYANSTEKLWAFDTSTHKKLWTKQLPFNSKISLDISPDNQTLYAYASDPTSQFTNLFAVNLETLAIKNLYQTTGSFWGMAVNDEGNLIYVADYVKGEMLALTTDTGEVKIRISNLDEPESLYLL